MQLLGYGEDALTLWALKYKISTMLKDLDDNTEDLDKCTVFYRPSFGRKGGDSSSEFGEFDFIIISQDRIYLGESKWEGSAKVKNGCVLLPEEQKLRHELLRFYIEQWFKWFSVNKSNDWAAFVPSAVSNRDSYNIVKPIAPDGSRLAKNLHSILQNMWLHFNFRKVEIVDVLMYLHKKTSPIPTSVNQKDFKLITIQYPNSVGNFIDIGKRQSSNR